MTTNRPIVPLRKRIIRTSLYGADFQRNAFVRRFVRTRVMQETILIINVTRNNDAEPQDWLATFLQFKHYIFYIPFILVMGGFLCIVLTSKL